MSFGTGNGYGDGRAISVLKFIQWEKNGNAIKRRRSNSYNKGADGRAVLRSALENFLLEFMDAWEYLPQDLLHFMSHNQK